MFFLKKLVSVHRWNLGKSSVEFLRTESGSWRKQSTCKLTTLDFVLIS
jgi:hypothetical protein